jgi:hypothetical protein
VNIVGALQVEEIALYNVRHVLSYYEVPVVENLALGEVEASHVDLAHELSASRALFASIIFI